MAIKTSLKRFIGQVALILDALDFEGLMIRNTFENIKEKERIKKRL